MANTGDADDYEYLAEMTKGANFAASSRCVRNKCQSTSSSSSFHSSGESSTHGSAADVSAAGVSSRLFGFPNVFHTHD